MGGQKHTQCPILEPDEREMDSSHLISSLSIQVGSRVSSPLFVCWIKDIDLTHHVRGAHVMTSQRNVRTCSSLSLQGFAGGGSIAMIRRELEFGHRSTEFSIWLLATVRTLRLPEVQPKNGACNQPWRPCMTVHTDSLLDLHYSTKDTMFTIPILQVTAWQPVIHHVVYSGICMQGKKSLILQDLIDPEIQQRSESGCRT